MTCIETGCRKRKGLVKRRCPEHMKLWNKAFYQRYRESRLEGSRDNQYRKLYGITLAERNAMAEAQNYRCKVCGGKECGAVGAGRLQVEHCHDCGNIRGLTCAGCNGHIGRHERGERVPADMVEMLDRYIMENCRLDCGVRLSLGIRIRERSNPPVQAGSLSPGARR